MLTTAPKLNRGIGLLEILITILIMAVGFLASARMQIQGLQQSQSAYYQSQAYLLASEIMDRMRLNPEGVLAGAYDNVSTNGVYPEPACVLSGCSGVNQAALDLHEWSLAINPTQAGVLPALPSTDAIAAVGIVDRIDVNRFEVRLSWSDVVNGSSEERSLDFSFVPTSL